MAIIDVWAFTAKMGEGSKAREWMKKVTDYHTSQGLRSRTLIPVNGNTERVFVEIEYESLGAMEEYRPKFFQSDAWKELNEEPWREWFVDDGIVRHQYRVVE